jgi:hypothetical protein
MVEYTRYSDLGGYNMVSGKYNRGHLEKDCQHFHSDPEFCELTGQTLQGAHPVNGCAKFSSKLLNYVSGNARPNTLSECLGRKMARGSIEALEEVLRVKAKEAD